MIFMRLKTKQLLLTITALFVLASADFAQAQTRAEPLRFGVDDEPGNCEINGGHLYIVREVMQQEPNPKGVLILVARLGTGETSRTWNQRRLYNTKRALEENINIPAEKIVATEGERINGFGRIECYWNGEFIGALVVRKNADICVRCCGSYPEYYPEKDVKKKPKRKRRE
ncbi:MAG: hypothetical protein H7Z37_05735 [Pyrinomonadaceae bacterium]|nr:hypothetical protein [Pyrinomonadaceae bacterium]